MKTRLKTVGYIVEGRTWGAAFWSTGSKRLAYGDGVTLFPTRAAAQVAIDRTVACWGPEVAMDFWISRATAVPVDLKKKG